MRLCMEIQRSLDGLRSPDMFKSLNMLETIKN
jgi:hypothetical protein